MDGKDLRRRLAELLNEDSTSGWLDTRSSYDYLYEAAVAFTDRTGCLTSTQTITTVADQSEYNLNADFMRLSLRDRDGDHIIRFYDGTTYNMVRFKPYNEIFYDNNTTSADPPEGFAIIDATPGTLESGTATSSGDDVGGKSLLTDTAASFTSVSPGDIVHNTTDGSDGVVISVPSSTTCYVALFGGTDNEWDTSDAYFIQPGARYKLVIDPPSETAGYTITVPYVQRPAPVYSDYDVYRFPQQYAPALVKYAYWLYKYRDEKPDYGDAMYRYFDAEVRRYLGSINRAIKSTRFGVSFKKS